MIRQIAAVLAVATIVTGLMASMASATHIATGWRWQGYQLGPYSFGPGLTSSQRSDVSWAETNWDNSTINPYFLAGSSTDPSRFDATAQGANGNLAWTSCADANNDGYWDQCVTNFNLDKPFGDATVDPTVFDFKSVALHEAGHWYSLNDTDLDQDKGLVMYYGLAIGQVKRTLTGHDYGAADFMYP